MILHRPIKAQNSVKTDITYAPWMEHQNNVVDVNNLAMPTIKGSHEYNKARRQGNLTTYNPETDTYEATNLLPGTTVTAPDLSIAKAVRTKLNDTGRAMAETGDVIARVNPFYNAIRTGTGMYMAGKRGDWGWSGEGDKPGVLQEAAIGTLGDLAGGAALKGLGTGMKYAAPGLVAKIAGKVRGGTAAAEEAVRPHVKDIWNPVNRRLYAGKNKAYMQEVRELAPQFKAKYGLDDAEAMSVAKTHVYAKHHGVVPENLELERIDRGWNEYVYKGNLGDDIDVRMGLNPKTGARSFDIKSVKDPNQAMVFSPRLDEPHSFGSDMEWTRDRREAGKIMNWMNKNMLRGEALWEDASLSSDSFNSLLRRANHPDYKLSVEGHIPANAMAKYTAWPGYKGKPGMHFFEEGTAKEVASSIDSQLGRLGLGKYKTKVVPYKETPGVYTLELPNPKLERVKRQGGILR